MPSLLSLSAGIVVLLGLGLSIGYVLAVKSRDEKIRLLEADARHSQGEQQRVVRLLERMKSETRGLSNFMVFMPDFARQINTNHEPARVVPIIVGILDQMFSPKQIAVFYADERGESKLNLMGSKGLGEIGKHSLSVRVGEGRVGWVAEHQVTMESNDFASQGRARGTNVEGDPAGLKLELYAPMTHDNKLIGIVAVGGMEMRHPEEKKMLKMVADLGSSALLNARLIQQIKHSADQDGLTGLFNKRAFMRMLGIAINSCERERSPLVSFIFDIDHFKVYNDTNGHLAGDEVLRTAGRILKSTARTGDIVARYGGEEFIIVMPDTDREAGLEAAERIRRAIQEYHFANEEKQPSGDLTISGGIAVFPSDGRSTSDLIGHADQALYQAKKAGRNRVMAYMAGTLGVTVEADAVQRR